MGPALLGMASVQSNLPLGVNGGDVEGVSLEPGHHEQSLRDGAGLGLISASVHEQFNSSAMTAMRILAFIFLKGNKGRKGERDRGRRYFAGILDTGEHRVPSPYLPLPVLQCCLRCIGSGVQVPPGRR